ncbi:MAG: hypothetical protein IPF55_06930 [Rhodoferax sp.]|nr:hypothetical protein [Rhodoferax sp.]
MRFDLNDYSIPHTHVQRPLTGGVRTGFAFWTVAPFLAEHARSYDKGAQVEIAAHVQALKEHKSRARQHSGVDRLSQAVPAMAHFWSAPPLRATTCLDYTHLTEYLSTTVARAMQEAVLEALRRDVPHPNAVRHALEHARELRQATPLVVPQLSERAQLLDVHVPTRGLGAYDALQAQATPVSPDNTNNADNTDTSDPT